MSTPEPSVMATDEPERSFYDKLTLGLVKSLEKRQGVCDVNLYQKPATNKNNLSAWEQKHACILPDDMKNFYLTNNGFKLSWNVRMNDARIAVGRMEINSLEGLFRIGGSNPSINSGGPTLADIQTESDDDDDANVPKYDQRSRIFEIDPCDGNGKVCLVYNHTKPGVPATHPKIWFMDRALQWHPLVNDFLGYYRLLLLHIGLPQWQYAFTPLGLTPHAKQWFHMYAPVRIELLIDHIAAAEESKEGHVTNQLDTGRVFKGKGDKKKPGAAQNIKKKPMAPTTKGAATSSMSRVIGGPTSVSSKTTK